MRNSNSQTANYGALRKLGIAALALIMSVCLITGTLFFFGGSLSRAEVITSEKLQGEVDKATEYGGELVIDVTGSGTDKVFTVSDKITVGTAKTVRFTASDDTKIVFTKGLDIASEAQVILDTEAEFKTTEINVSGTLEINHRLLNTTTVNVKNNVDKDAELVSYGVIIGGSFNNDAEKGGRIVLDEGANISTRKSTEYTTPDSEQGNVTQSTHSNNDGGALMLKADGASLGLTNNGGLITNNGSLIYDNSVTDLSALTSKTDGTPAVAATFTSSLQTGAGTYVIYDGSENGAGLTFTGEKALSNVNLLAFGKVTLTRSSADTVFTVNNTVSLGGGETDGNTFTQGANELIFDGGAKWSHGSTEYDYSNGDGEYIIFYAEDNKPYSYNEPSLISKDSAFFKVNGGALNMYGGAKITNYANSSTYVSGSGTTYYPTRGGGVYLNSTATFNMYGGEISYCGVYNINNGSVGAGVFSNQGTVKLYGGKVTHNAASTVGTEGSADGPGVATIGGTVKLYGGELSYNHTATGRSDANADGGGLMLDGDDQVPDANMYGGSIKGNFAGGSGGAICGWKSTFTMYGGSIEENTAAYGGGIGVTSNSSTDQSNLTILAGEIKGNKAFENYYNSNRWGGYGGAICLGSNVHQNYSNLTVKETAEITGNEAYYGGGLAIYTSGTANISNQLTMSGGIISGNASYDKPTETEAKAQFAYGENVPANGGGVYVNYTGTVSRPALLLSGDATIDSSNTVSINAGASTTAPIQVNGELTGSGLGALVYLSDSSITAWGATNNNNNRYQIIQYANTSYSYLNKFVLDHNTRYLRETTITVTNRSVKGISIAPISETGKIIAGVVDPNATGSNIYSSTHTTLSDAIATAASGSVIEITQSATLGANDRNIIIDKNITIQPASGLDVTLIIASTTSFTNGSSLFSVNRGGNLTINGTNGTGSRLTFDANGVGRSLNQGVISSTLVSVDSGTFTLTGNAYLRNNYTADAGSAVKVSSNGGTFNMESGAVIENNNSTNPNGSAVLLDGGTFNWNGGKIQNNETTGEGALANYGVSVSGTNATMTIGGAVELINNSIYLGAGHYIDVAAGYDSGNSSVIPLVLPDVSRLTAGDAVVRIANAANGAIRTDVEKINEKFTLSIEQAGLSLGLRASTDSGFSHAIIIYRTTTYLFQSAYDGNTTDGINLGDFDRLAGGLKDLGAVEVKKRNGGYTLAVEIRYGTPLSSIQLISDYFSREGYTIQNWTNSADSTKTHGYNATVEYQNTTIVVNAGWQENEYVVTFNTNAPRGSQSPATVNGDMDAQIQSGTGLPGATYTLTDVNSAIPDYNYTITGFVFKGWSTSASADGATAMFSGDILNAEDINVIQKNATDTRGRYALTVYAVWENLFGGGIGTQATPFVISTSEHLERLHKTVMGEEIILDRKWTYYSTSEEGYVNKNHSASDYSTYYFRLALEDGVSGLDYTGTIGDATHAFAGAFDGNNKTINLNNAAGGGLFAYLNGATVRNIYVGGTVTGSGYVGALANNVLGSSIENAGSIAAVTSQDGVAGGIAGKTDGTATLTGVFNAGAVNGKASAGGIVGEMVSGTVQQAFNSGAVVSEEAAGGIVGKADSDKSKTISVIYNTGAISGAAYAGGIAGGPVENAEIAHGYNGGTVSGDGKNGALIGSSDNVSINRLYYNSDKTLNMSATGDGALDGAIPLTSSKMVVTANGSRPGGMAITGAWTYAKADSGYYYPQLSTFVSNDAVLGTKTVSEISAESVRLTYIKDDVEEPLPDSQTFRVTFVLNGGEFTDTDAKYKPDGNNYYAEFDFNVTSDKINTVPEPKSPVRTGYVFDCWCTDEWLNNEYLFESGVSATDITLYARWKEQEYRINYNRADGEPLTGEYNDKASLKDKDGVKLAVGENEQHPDNYNTRRNGYYFDYWRYTGTDYKVDTVKIEENDSGEITVRLYYGNVETYSFVLDKNDNPDTVLDFTAVWTLRDYSITYNFLKQDDDGNYSSLSGAVYNYGNPVTFTVEDEFTFITPTLTGYTFVNWLAGDMSTSTVGVTKGTYSDLTVYGVFEANKYNVTLDAREGSLVKGGKVLEDGDLTDLGFVQNTTTGLYYMTVNYGETLNKKFEGIKGNREGYDFKGWHLSPTPTATSEFNFDNPYNTTADITLYAVYKVKEYTITVRSSNEAYFDADDFSFEYKPEQQIETGKITVYTTTVSYGQNAYGYLVTPKIYGDNANNKFFSGWTVNEPAKLDDIFNVKKDIDVTAQFGTSGFSVVFTNVDKSSVFTFNGVTTDEGSIAANGSWAEYKANILNPEREGYVFNGWRMTGSYDLIKFSENPASGEVDPAKYTFNGACVLFAEYTPVDVRVSFTLPDAYFNDDVTPDTPQAQTYAYDTKFTNLPQPEYPGFKFMGWYLGDTLITASSAVGENATKGADGTDGTYSVQLTGKWSENPIQYEILYVFNSTDAVRGGTALTESYDYTKTLGDGIVLPVGDDVASRTGFELTGWLGEAVERLADGTYKLKAGTTGDLILTAEWSIKSYSVTFLAGEGGRFTVPQTVTGGTYYDADDKEVTAAGAQAVKYVTSVMHGLSATQPVIPEKDGYQFINWNETITNTITNITKDSTFSPVYTPRSYTLYLSANGGTFGGGSTMYTYSEKIPFKGAIPADLPKPESVSSTFAGWKDGSGNDVTQMPARDLTLFAQWTVKTYTVTVSAETLAQDGYIVTNNDELLSLLAVFNPELKDGKVVFTVEHGDDLTALNGIKKPDGTAYTLILRIGETPVVFSVATDDVTVLAIWFTSKNIVTFDYGYDEKSETFHYADGASIIFPTPVRTGYTFDGWYDKDNNKVESATASGEATYFAHWTAERYSVTFIDASDKGTAYYTFGQPIDLGADPEKEGYSFEKWYTDSDFKNLFVYVEGKTYGNLTLFAKWTVETYTVILKNYATNDNTTAREYKIELTYGTPVPDVFTALWSRDYHKVTIYSDVSLQTEYKKPSSPTVGDMGNNGAVINLYAKYEAETYLVTFKNADGSVVDSIEYSFGAENLSLTTAEKAIVPEGHDFVCWGYYGTPSELVRVDTLNFTGEKVVLNGATQITANVGLIELYPMYGTRKYTVTFDKNATDAEGAMDSLEFVYGITKAIPKCEFTLAGYTFGGWKIDGDEIVYPDNGALTLTGTETEVTLKAQWNPVTYTLILDLNGGVGNVNTSVLIGFGGEYTLPEAGAITRTGHNFVGWYLGTTHITSNKFTVTGDIVKNLVNTTAITLQARWELVLYTVTFNLNGGNIDGETEINSITVNYGEKYNKLDTFPNDPVRDGYTFAGWECYGSTINSGSTVTVALNHTLVAQWNAIEYTVELYDGNEKIGEEKLSFAGTYSVNVTRERDGYSFDGWEIEGADKPFNVLYLSEILNYFKDGKLTVTASWSMITYSIVLVPDGGTLPQSIVENGNVVTYTIEDVNNGNGSINISEFLEEKGVTLTREGYDFAGWFTNSSKSDDITVISGANLYKNLTLYADWSRSSITFSVSSGEGTWKNLPDGYTKKEGTDDLTFTFDYGTDIYSRLSELQGYLEAPDDIKQFLLWTNDGTRAGALTSFSLVNESTITALFSDTDITVTLVYLDGAKSTVNIIARNSEYTPPTEHSCIEGYDTYGWAYYGDGGAFVDGTELHKSITLRETAQAKQVQVTLDNNGSKDNKEVTFGLAYGAAVSDPDKGRVGYVFAGWYTADGKLVTAETIVNTTVDHELTAKWTPIRYNVAFDLAKGNGTTVPQTVYFGDGTDTISLNQDVTRIGYNFLGWQIGNITYTEESVKLSEELIKLLDTDSTLIKFTAVWEETTYVVKFTSDDVVRGTVNLKYGDDGTKEVKLDVVGLEKTYYELVGWTLDGGTYAVGITLGIQDIIALAGDDTTVNFTAEWQAINYTITYNLGGGTNNADNPQYLNVSVSSVTLKDPTRTGYNFVRWYDGDNDTVTVLTLNAQTKNFTVNAEWEAIKYTLVYDGEPEWFPADLLKNWTMETSNGRLALSTLTRPGYTFGGWIIDGNDSTIYRGGINIEMTSILASKGDSTVITLRPVWSDAVYVIEYEPNGGVNNNENPLSAKLNDVVVLKAPSRAHYVFLGWYESADFAGEAVESFSIGGNVKFYAKWEREQVEIEASIDGWTFNVNGNSNDPVDKDGNTFDSRLYGVLYGTPKLTARANTYSISDYDWSAEKPENAGTYYLLVYYLFDGANTAMPTDEDENGWIIVEFNVGRADNTVSISDLTCTYGDEINPEVTCADNADIKLYYRADGSSTWIEGLPENAGKYTIKAESAETRNYNSATSNEAQLVIKKAKLTVSAEGTGVYGDAFSAGNCDISYVGFKFDDDESVLNGTPVISVPEDFRNVRTYALTINVNGVTADNYELVASSGSYTVTKRAITVTIGNIESVYTARIDLNGVTLICDELVSGDSIDSITVKGYSTIAKDDSPAGGIYPITITGYTSGNYEVEFINGYYNIAPLGLTVEITVENSVYGEEFTAPSISGISANDDRANIDSIIKEVLEGNYLMLYYSGSDFEQENIHENPYEVPTNAGLYFATAVVNPDNQNANYRFTNSSKAFMIQKKTLPDVVIPSRTYTGASLTPSIGNSEYFTYTVENYVEVGRYPVTLTLKPEYAHNLQWANGTSVTAIFEITKAVNGFVKNDFSISGWAYGQYDAEKNLPVSSGAMFGEITYTYSDSANGVYTANSPASYKAGTYYVRAEVAGTPDYEGFISDPVSFTVSRQKVNIPSGGGEELTISGLFLTYIPEGFDESLMSIENNVQSFKGNYKAIIKLLDKENYEWSDGTVRDLEYDWSIVGINKWFVAIITVVSVIAAAGVAVAATQIVLHRRKKRLNKALSEELTASGEEEAAAEESGSDGAEKSDNSNADKG